MENQSHEPEPSYTPIPIPLSLDGPEPSYTPIPIPLSLDGPRDPNLFLPAEPDRPLTRKEKEWVQVQIQTQAQARDKPEETNQRQRLDLAKTARAVGAAPSAPALRALNRALQKYQGDMPGTREEWRNFVMTKYFELANDIDPKISKGALDAIARTNVVGLHVEEQTININTRTTVELEAELNEKLGKLLKRTGGAGKEEIIEAEWEEK